MFEKKAKNEAKEGINLILENLGDFVGFYEKNKEEYPLDNAEELINSIGDCTNLTKIRNWKTAGITKKTSQNSNFSKKIKNNPVQNLKKIIEIQKKLFEYKQKTLEKKEEKSIEKIKQEISQTRLKISPLLRRKKGQKERYLSKIKSGNNQNILNQNILNLKTSQILEKTQNLQSNEEQNGGILKGISNIAGKTRNGIGKILPRTGINSDDGFFSTTGKGVFYLGKKAWDLGKGTANLAKNSVNLGSHIYREIRD